MTATLTIVLLGLAFLLIVFLAFPISIWIANWMEDFQPGLLENLKFWAWAVAAAAMALAIIVGVQT